MNVGASPGKRSSSATLVVTFVLGIGIGFALCYALFDSLRSAQDDPGKPDRAEAGAPGTTAPSQASAEIAGVDGLWPGRHVFVGISGASLDEDTKELLRVFKPGGVILRAENLSDEEQTAALVADVRAAIGLGDAPGAPPFVAVAQEGGAQNPLGLDPAPAPRELGEETVLSRVTRTARRYGAAARGRGIGVVLAPALDVGPGPQSFGNDRATVVRSGMAFAAGLRAAGVLPVVKHYPGAGAAEGRDDGVPGLVADSFEDLAAAMLPFQQAVKNGIRGMLAAHVAVPLIDPEHPELPASLSPKLIRAVLRDKWAYQGVVLADDIGPLAPMINQEPGVIAVRALAAGCDAVVYVDAAFDELQAVCEAIQRAVRTGALNPERLDEAKVRFETWEAQLRAAGPAVPEPAPADPTAAAPEPAPAQPPAAPAETEGGSGETAAEGGAPPEPAPGSGGEGEPAPDDRQGQGPTPGPSAPAPKTHTIASGEALESIAKQYGVTVAQLKEWNAIEDTDTIQAGRELIVSPPAPEGEPAKVPEPGASAAADEKASTPEGEPPAESEPKPQTHPEAQKTPAEGEPGADTAPPQTAEEPAPDDAAGSEEKPAPEENQAEDADGTPTPAPDGSDTAAAAPDEPSADTEDAGAPAAEAPPLPEETEAYIVQRGDTLIGIAERFGTTKGVLLRLNALDRPNLVWVGQRLKVPKQRAEPEPPEPPAAP